MKTQRSEKESEVFQVFLGDAFPSPLQLIEYVKMKG